MFEIKKISTQLTFYFKLNGRLDTKTSSIFDTYIKPYLKSEKFIILDFTSCNYLSSSGIRSLLIAEKTLQKVKGHVLICNLPFQVFQVLEMSGLNNVFEIFENREAALQTYHTLNQQINNEEIVEIDNYTFKLNTVENKNEPLLIWNNQGIASYKELGFSIGVGSPAESLNDVATSSGIFITSPICGGFLPFNSLILPDFKIPQDTSTCGILVDWAMSFGASASAKLNLAKPTNIRNDELLNTLINHSLGTNLHGVIITDFDSNTPNISIIGILKEGHKQLKNKKLPHNTFIEIKNNKKICGAKFILDHLPKSSDEFSLNQLIHEVLTFENILDVQHIDLSSTLTSPALWLFTSDKKYDASNSRLVINYPDEIKLNIYEEFLIRRLYVDSSRIKIKPLHGGFSAQTFQVESYDTEGRKLRPTVLKIADRDIIKREAQRCQKYAMPYILNNSAIVLGTEFHATIGSLRYNFVGIGGERNQLKWLTHYFKNWSIEKLEPLFDKIFLQILNPWYGQPVQGKIYPFKDHDPTLSFFPNLCETAEQLFSISADEHSIVLSENRRKIGNPYWLLKHKYAAYREYAINYPSSICHGDLNMQNILLDQDMNVYLIDFSETKPRSIVSDFARLEAIFMIENSPMETDEDLKLMIDFVLDFYNKSQLDQLPENNYKGIHTSEISKNVALIQKMRNYALTCSSNNQNILPYYMALLEWVLPVVCYSSASENQKRLSMVIAGVLCDQVMLEVNKQ